MPVTRFRMTASPSSSRNTTSLLTRRTVWSDTFGICRSCARGGERASTSLYLMFSQGRVAEDDTRDGVRARHRCDCAARGAADCRHHRCRLSGERGAKEHAACRRVFQKRDDEVAMAVEGRGAAHERHQTVGAREREEAVDVLVAEALRDAAQDELPAQLRSEAPAP